MVDCVQYINNEKSVELFKRMNVLSKVELDARAIIDYEGYAKAINIEALVMVDMVNKELLPAILKYEGTLAKEAADISANGIDPKVQKGIIQDIELKVDELKKATDALSKKLEKAPQYMEDVKKWAYYYKEVVFDAFDSVRLPADQLEDMVAKNAWPIPTYEELLFEIGDER